MNDTLAGAQPRYQMSADYVLRRIAGDYVIIPVGDGHVFGNAMLTPNRSAGFLWNLFSQPRSLEEAVALVMEEFDGPADQIRAMKIAEKTEPVLSDPVIVKIISLHFLVNLYEL